MSQRPTKPIDDTALFLIMLLGTMVALVTVQEYKEETLPEPIMQFIRGVILGVSNPLPAGE